MIDHEKAVMIYCCGVVHELQTLGLIKPGGPVRISARGIAGFDQLFASGFRPTGEDIRDCVAFLSTQFGGNVSPDHAALCSLIENFEAVKTKGE